MYTKLKLEIETLMGCKVEILTRNNINKLDLILPEEWEVLRNNNYSIVQIINEVWRPASDNFRNIVEILSGNVIDLLLIKSLENDFSLYLCYVFKMTSLDAQETYFEAWLAGLPAKQNHLMSHTNLPDSYRVFCGIHNGFLLNGNFSDGFLPIDKVEIIPYKNQKKRLLGFCKNGIGDIRCFNYESKISENDFETVYWDHESDDIDDPLPFWEFAYNYISDNTLDLPINYG